MASHRSATEVALLANVEEALERYRSKGSKAAAEVVVDEVLKGYRKVSRGPVRGEPSPMARLGERHGRARLSAKQVNALRQWAKRYFDRNLTPPWTSKARDEGIAEGTLRDLAKQRTWRYPNRAKS